jgi:hypothetical protein
MSLASALDDLCRACVALLPVSGAAVHLMAQAQVVGVVAASDARAASIGELPFVAGLGPCLDAYRLRRPVLVADLEASAARWPGFAESAIEQGVAAVYSLPLQSGAVGLGVLDLYADRAGPLAPDDVGHALGLARDATDLLISGDGGVADRAIDAVIDHRAEIYQAQGALVVALGVTLAEAMVLLRAHAFSQGLPLLDLSRQVVGGSSQPEEW